MPVNIGEVNPVMESFQTRETHQNDDGKENKKEIEMYKKEGYWDVRPKIKRLSFPKRGKFQVDLQDGRSVMMPISAFPSLKRMPAKERDNWYLMGGGVTWDACSEVIHIEQILGNYQNYAHESV
jgi:hypothetical protein